MASIAPLFTHRWATRIYRDNPFYRRSANRIIEVSLTPDALCSRVMVPFLRFGVPDIRIPLAKIVQFQRETFWGFTTVQVTYHTQDNALATLEHAFTTLLPFPLVTNADEALLQALKTLDCGKAESKLEL